VKGSTTSPNKFLLLLNENIKPYNFLITDELLSDGINDFFESEILIINFPPPRANNDDTIHLQQIKSIVSHATQGKVRSIIFISSTSVYSEVNRIVYEDDEPNPISANGIALRKVENYLLNNIRISSTILRFGGLIGPGRQPVKYFSGRKNIDGGNIPVNLIHLSDCISVTKMVISEQICNEIINVVSPKHPSKKEFYTEAALKRGLQLPEFNDIEGEYKIVSSEKLLTRFGYKFIYDNPLDFPIED
jgi:nucleoside-diphosphate-sugar epimerase